MNWVHRSELAHFGGGSDSDDDLMPFGFGAGGGLRGSRAGGPAPIDANPDEDDAEVLGAPDLADPGAGTLAHALANPEGAGFGEFTFGGKADSLPVLPGLVIEGVGPVAVPLTDPDVARKIAGVGRMAPFGRDTETVMDTSVRKTWQIDAGKIKVTHPEWQKGFDELVKGMADRLGCPQLALQVKLYKGLLYEEGCFFKRHRDTEKEDGMFATLVVQMPSLHAGGELVVWQQDGSTTTTHDFGAAAKSAEWACHYAVHYADAEHELLPVTKGYRLALVYSICYPTHQPAPAADLALTASANRQHLVSALTHLSTAKSAFHLFLAHQYTHKSITDLGFNALKGHDRARIARIQQANAALSPNAQFHLLITSGARVDEYACLAHIEEGDDWRAFGPSEWERTESDENVHMWYYGATGEYVDRGGPASKFDALGELVNPEAKRKADLWKSRKENRVQYTGNEGATLQQIYRRYLVVGIPKSVGMKRLAEVIGVCGAFRVTFKLDAGDSVDGEALGKYLVDSRTMNQEQRQRAPILFKDVSQSDALEVIVSKYVVNAFPTFLETFSVTSLPAKAIPLLTRAMREHAEDDWLLKLLPSVVALLERMPDKFVFGLDLIQAALADGVTSSASTWLPLLPAMLTPPPVLTRDQLVDQAFQTKLWNIAHAIASSGDQPALAHVDTIVQAHLLANSPQDLATAVTTLIPLLPSLITVPTAPTSHFLPLLQARYNWLHARTLQGQALLAQPTWAMPDARFPANPAIQAFLHSPTDNLLRVNDFATITAARAFVKQYGTPGPNDAYSWVMKEDGRGRGSFVTITKTGAWLEKEAGRIQELMAEAGRVFAVIQQIAAEMAQRAQQQAVAAAAAAQRKRPAAEMLAGEGAAGASSSAAGEPSAKHVRISAEE